MLRKSLQKVRAISRSNSNNSLTEDQQFKEMVKAEYTIVCSRPQPPMHSRHQQSKNQKQLNGRRPNLLCKSTSSDEHTYFEMKKLLAKSEAELTESEKLATTLLEQNKELQEKNDFLEESIITSKEEIAQLTRQSKQYRELFQKISNIEGQDVYEQQIDQQRQCNSANLENKIRKLEEINAELRSKVKDTEKLKAMVEKREEQRINEYISQLRAANLKADQLQIQLGEKSRQLEVQNDEVRKLLMEIGQRKSREKQLWEENDDLHFRLEKAVSEENKLRTEMKEMQEYHLELVEMYRDMEMELKVHREAALAMVPPRRNNSTDSLYDSLASELEGADSGCYGTPILSERYGPSPHWSSLSNNDRPSSSYQADNMQPIAEYSTTKGNNEEENTKNSMAEDTPQAQSFVEIPSKALLQAVRSTFEDRRLFRRTSPSRNHQQKDESCDKMEREQEETDEQQTPTVNEKSIWRELECEKSNTNEQQLTEQLDGTEESTRKKIELRDASCSPIQFTSNEKESGTWKGLEQSQSNYGISEMKHETIAAQDTFTSPVQTHRSDNAASPSTSSDDSLDEYSSPKMGVPGRPGTRDLDYRIRKMGLRKQIDEKYKQFRVKNGLIPANKSFYTSNKFFSSVEKGEHASCKVQQHQRFPNSPVQIPNISAFSRLANKNCIANGIVTNLMASDLCRSSSNHELSHSETVESSTHSSSTFLSHLRPAQLKCHLPNRGGILAIQSHAGIIGSSIDAQSVDHGINNLTSPPNIPSSAGLQPSFGEPSSYGILQRICQLDLK